jgi:hypothetical protein
MVNDNGPTPGSGADAWVISADMGYGHMRAAHPFAPYARGGIILAGSPGIASPAEQRIWTRFLRGYELLSRARGIPLLGRPLFGILDGLLHIPSFYPMRDLSTSTIQVDLLASSIRQGLCAGAMERVRSEQLPVLTPFYAPAITADMQGVERIYCIICDADLSRVWVAREPWESRIHYCAPCGKAAQRLRAYGVPEERIHITGFPFSETLLGDAKLTRLKQDLGQRLRYLDPEGDFFARHGKSVDHFLGPSNLVFRRERTLTITYAVGGAGAQKEFGRKIAHSLAKPLRDGQLVLNLIAGTKPTVRDYFLDVAQEIDGTGRQVRVLYAETPWEYFRLFDDVIRTTDVLWTKPSELSFYTALGLPIIYTPALGPQERFNRYWLRELHSGMRQLAPEHTAFWLMDFLRKGILAEAAWSGFLKARKKGTYKILELLRTGGMTREASQILR